KYQHRFCNTEFGSLKFSPQELAVVCELLIRGPQTPGELRARVVRMASFSDIGEVEAALDSLAVRADGPFVVQLPREAGRRDSRYAHLFSGTATIPVVTEESGREPSVASSSMSSRLESLEEAVRQLREELMDIKARLPPQ